MSHSTEYRRGSEAPMDFEYTNRPNVKPIWAQEDPNDNVAGSSSPRKRPHDVTTPHTPFTSDPPRFGFNTGHNVPFIFASPPSQPPPSMGWAPPQDFSPAKAFPDLQDVDMVDASPPKPAAEESSRAVALGGLKRVFRRREQRRKAAERAHDATDGSESDAEDNDENEGSGLIRRRPIQKTTSHHYTLNMPSAAAPRSELPALLLGYLQFFFNLSLVLVFLYLLLQFILMVQRDVEQKISEYSLDILQEISTCTTHYEKNDCAGNPGPWVAQQCPVWEQCMARDPTKIGRTRVSAELIAETVNSLVDPISWKALAFTLTSLAFLTLFINSLFTLFRGRLAPPIAPVHIPTPIAPGPGFPMLPPYPTHPASPWSQWRPEESEEAPRLRRRLEDGVEKKGR